MSATKSDYFLQAVRRADSTEAASCSVVCGGFVAACVVGMSENSFFVSSKFSVA